jgi:hypothetical protein
MLDWLPDFVRIKHDLLVGKYEYKLAFVPPGARFDPKLMDVVNERLFEHNVDWHVSEYRVKLCVWPSLNVLGKEEMPDDVGTMEDYRRALLSSRKFFPATPGQCSNWDDPIGGVMSKAKVLVEKVSGKDVTVGLGPQPTPRARPL